MEKMNQGRTAWIFITSVQTLPVRKILQILHKMQRNQKNQFGLILLILEA